MKNIPTVSSNPISSPSLPLSGYPVNLYFSLKSFFSILSLDELTSTIIKEKLHNKHSLDLQYIRLGVKNPGYHLRINHPIQGLIWPNGFRGEH
jgi:hypothetical protein